jgi:hypothetical protein
VIDNKAKILIQGYGNHDAHSTLFYGSITLQGANCTRIRMKDICVYGNSTEPPLTINGTQGRHYFQNVTFYPETYTAGDAVLITGDFEKWADFIECTFMGNIKLDSKHASNWASVSLNRCKGDDAESTIEINDDFGVGLNECTRISTITHDAGTLVMRNVSLPYTTAGDAIVSTVTAANNGLLYLEDVSFAAGDGSLGTINKTGDCPWMLANCNRDVANDTLNGTRMAYGAHAVDVEAGFTPSAYTATDDSVEGHLQGIDSQLTLQGTFDNGNVIQQTATDRLTIKDTDGSTIAIF